MSKIAQLLVACEYAVRFYPDPPTKFPIILVIHDSDEMIERVGEPCDPYSDTLEGRRQACVLWSHLYKHHEKLWDQSYRIIPDGSMDQWEQILLRLDWCIERLEDE